MISIMVVALSVPTGLILRDTIDAWSRTPHELPLDHLNVPWYSFIAGAVFAMLSFMVLDWVIRRIQGRERCQRVTVRTLSGLF